MEVLSPTSGEMDREDKFALYEKRGVAHYWIVDPDAQGIEAYVLNDGRYIQAARGSANQIVCLPPFDDLTIELSEIWPQGVGSSD